MAHRGWSSRGPENTLYAIELALKEKKIDKIEIDVQMTKDGIIVLHHDFELGRTSNGKGLISEYSYEELLKLDFGGWFSADFTGERILTLKEVLDLIGNTKDLIIEIKKGGSMYPHIATELCHVLKPYSLKNIYVKSFNHEVVKEVADINHKIKTGILIYGKPVLLKEQMKYAKASFVSIAYPYITKELLDHLYQDKIEVMVWTVDNKKHMEDIKKLDKGIGIITNYPELGFK
ncbi:hypothetical protein TZ02_08700 [Clostridium aceticum]|nr:hypothetical protein TZ02_08700 [Clostridium aceticum]